MIIMSRAMTFGKLGKQNLLTMNREIQHILNTLKACARTKEEVSKVIDVFQKHCHSETETTRVYGNGTTKQILSNLS